MGLLKTAVVAIGVYGTLTFLWNTIVILDWGKTIHNHAPGPCHIVEGVENGSEDIQTLQNGLAFISSGLRFLGEVGSPQKKHIKGKLHQFDFNSPQTPPVELKIVGLPNIEDFSPHGISLWVDGKGGVSLYVINHLVSADRVEKFTYDAKTKLLKYIKSITDESFTRLNDLVIVEEDQFYVTNFYFSVGEPGWTIEKVLRLNWGQVVYFDGNKGHVVAASGMNAPNGINISPDKKYVYVGCLGDFRLFQREPDNNLTLKQVIAAVGRVDNIDIYNESGHTELWIGAHPIRWQLDQYLAGQRPSAPSQVLRLTMDGERITSVTEIYADDGHRIFGSSVATRHKDAILVGTVNHKLMYCKLQYAGN